MTTVSFSHYYFLDNILSSKRSYCDRPFCDRQEDEKKTISLYFFANQK